MRAQQSKVHIILSIVLDIITSSDAYRATYNKLLDTHGTLVSTFVQNPWRSAEDCVSTLTPSGSHILKGPQSLIEGKNTWLMLRSDYPNIKYCVTHSFAVDWLHRFQSYVRETLLLYVWVTRSFRPLVISVTLLGHCGIPAMIEGWLWWMAGLLRTLQPSCSYDSELTAAAVVLASVQSARLGGTSTGIVCTSFCSI
jgi:hypothetical protein